jgi:hypothetical protein
MSPFLADCVEKVENREAPKISRMSNVGDLSRIKALQNRYERRWSPLRYSMWPSTSQRARRTSGPENFQSSTKKDFFNTIGTLRTFHRGGLVSVMQH